MASTVKTSPPPTTPSDELVELGTDLSPAVKALEAAYRLVRRQFPDAPPVTIVVKRDLVAWGHTTVAKVWAPAAKADATGSSFELMVSGENLRRGARDVAGTLLHEAAHARNLAAGVIDTDTNGRHNLRFAERAREHGLTVEQLGWHGWTKTELPESALVRPARGAHRQPHPTRTVPTWQGRIVAVIAKGLAASAATAPANVDHLPAGELPGAPAPVAGPGAKGRGGKGRMGGLVAPPKRGNRNLPKATCGCGHSIRASWGVLDTAAPTCQVCGQPFTATEPRPEQPAEAQARCPSSLPAAHGTARYPCTLTPGHRGAHKGHGLTWR